MRLLIRVDGPSAANLRTTTKRDPNLPVSAAMEGINRYSRELSSDEIAQGKHRFEVGGIWDEVGPLRLEFLRRQRTK